MRTWLVLLVVICACGGKPASQHPVSNAPPAGRSTADKIRVEQLIAKMTEFANDTCKCVDQDCLLKVGVRISGWIDGKDSKDGKPPMTGVSTKDEDRQLDALSKRMEQCMNDITPNTPLGGDPCAGGPNPCGP